MASRPVVAPHSAACVTPAIAYTTQVAHPSNSARISILFTDARSATRGDIDIPFSPLANAVTQHSPEVFRE